MITNWEGFEQRIESLKSATYEIEDPANLIRDLCNIVGDLSRHVKESEAAVYPGSPIQIYPSFIVNLVNHQLIGATVKFQKRSYTVTGARRKKHTNDLEFRLLGLKTLEEHWTEANPIFDNINFPPFRTNKALKKIRTE